MNNISDKNVLIIMFSTIIVVFAFIFSIKSPERKVIESPIMWKEDFSTKTNLDLNIVELKNSLYI